MTERSLRDKMHCRLNGKDTAKLYSINDALLKLERFIWQTAGKFHSRSPHLDLDDLYQQGCIGLFTAWQRFDITKGVAFTTYANWYLYKHIQTFAAATEYSITLNSQNQKIYKELCQSQGSTKSVPMTEKNKALALLARCDSSLGCQSDKDEFSEEDYHIQEAEGKITAEPAIQEILKKLQKALQPKEYYVIIASSGLIHHSPMSPEEIAEKLDESLTWVSAIKEQHAGIMMRCLERVAGVG